MMDHSASKRNESLIYAAMGMDLENIMLSEINQAQKDKLYMIPFDKEMKNGELFKG